MGNKKLAKLTPGSLKKAERDLLAYSGLTTDEYEVRKVFVNEQETIFMTTILVGNPESPPLVLVHGFGGSGALYYKVMKGLAENFYVIVIDLVGMGSSSRPAWQMIQNGEEADEYFMNAIEQWRINMGDLTNFFIAAHSYGGYLFGTYAALYPQHVRKLLLLSPLGVKMAPPNYKIHQMRFRRGRKPPRWAVAFAKTLWGKVSPLSLFQLRTENKVRQNLNRYIRRAQPVNSPQEQAALAEYLF